MGRQELYKKVSPLHFYLSSCFRLEDYLSQEEIQAIEDSGAKLNNLTNKMIIPKKALKSINQVIKKNICILTFHRDLPFDFNGCSVVLTCTNGSMIFLKIFFFNHSKSQSVFHFLLIIQQTKRNLCRICMLLKNLLLLLQ